MEMHIVHFNEKYGTTIDEAEASSNGAPDTLAVVGVLFQLQNRDNRDFEKIIHGKNGII